MEKLIEVFKAKANHLETELNQMIDAIHRGYAPENEHVERVDILLSDIHATYESIQAKAKLVCGEIDGKLSIEEYYNRYEAEQALLRTTQLEKAREMLRRFLEIQATREDYANAIQRHKDEAQIKLDGNIEDIPDTTAEGLFLQALALDSIPEELNDRLDEYYVGKITRGLAKKVYYIPSPANPANEKEAVLPHSPAVAAELPTENPVTHQEEVLDADATATHESEVQSEEHAKYESISELSDAEGTPDFLASEPATTISARKVISVTKLPSKQEFNSILSQTGNLFYTITWATSCFGVVEKNWLYNKMKGEKARGISQEQFQVMLDRLENKGYIWIYEFDDMEVIGRSKYLVECLAKSSLSDIVKHHVPKKEQRSRFAVKSVFAKSVLRTRISSIPVCEKIMQILEGMPELEKQITSVWNVEAEDGTISVEYASGEEERINLVLSTVDAFGSTQTVDNCGIICYSPVEPDICDVADTKHYCLTDDSLLVWNGTSWNCLGGTRLPASIPENHIPTEVSNQDAMPTEMNTGTHPDADSVSDEALDLIDAGEGEGLSEDTDFVDCPTSNESQPVSEATDTICTTESPVIIQTEDISQYGILSDSSIEEICLAIINNQLEPSHYSVYMALINAVISSGKRPAGANIPHDSVAQGIILLKALAMYDRVYEEEYERLCMAVDSSAKLKQYSGSSILYVFENDGGIPEHLPVYKLMAVIRALIAPEEAHDYALNSYAESLFHSFDSIFPELEIVKPLYNLALRIKDLSPSGYSLQVLKMTANTQSEKAMLSSLVTQAQKLIALPPAGNGFVAMPGMLSRCFGSASTLGECIDYVARDDRSCRELVELMYRDAFCTQNETQDFVLSEDKIQEYYDGCWASAKSTYRGVKDLDQDHQRKVFSYIHERLKVIGQWLDLTEKGGNLQRSIVQLAATKKEILATIKRIKDNIISVSKAFNRAIILSCLDTIEARLECSVIERENEFDDFLRTGYVCMDANGIPVLHEAWISSSQYPVTLAILRHISSPDNDLRDTLQKIADKNNLELYDNLGQAILICKRLGLSSANYEEDIVNAEKSANKAIDDFKGELELAFAYGRISENDKEYILEELQQSILVFFETKYFGTLRSFLNALRKKIDLATQVRAKQLTQDIDRRLSQNPPEALVKVLHKAQAKVQNEERNYVVAEEYINRFDAGITDDIDLSDMAEDNAFLTFIGDKTYTPLYELCRTNPGRALASFGTAYVVAKLKKENVSSQYQASSERLLKKYPNRPDNVTPRDIEQIMVELGFGVRSVKQLPNPGKSISTCHFEVVVNPDDRDKAEYTHPVDIMGTNIASPMDVICLFGKVQPNSIVSTICGMELGHTAIVFLNGALSLNDRRQIAEIYHKERSGQNPFILIDWVLMIHLALHELTKRLPIMLNCTLPFTSSFKPFVEKGSVPDEMFIGRKKELNQILDPRGPTIVYGGRQLGKTALLERASSLANKPAKSEYAIMLRSSDYTWDEGVTEESLVRAIVEKLSAEGLSIEQSIWTSRDLYKHLESKRRQNAWKKILILIDEADRMLEGFRKLNPAYKPLIPLSELAQVTKGQFKFVLAGLHNVCRAANDPNTIFGQLGSPLCIKPLTAADSLELLSKPLRYLGFNVNPGQLESFLVNTSFYPGIVHYVGYSLVENLMTRYSEYYQASRSNPPYQLTQKQFGEILSSGKLNEKIDERITWTLEADPHYLALACCIAYLYNNDAENNKNGHSIEMIRTAAEIFDLPELYETDIVVIRNLLDEMVDMGILVKPTSGTYRLRQKRFLDAIGPSDERISQKVERMKHCE